jgi:hypothetical protein
MIIGNRLLKDIYEDQDTAYLYLDNNIYTIKLRNTF